MSLLRGFTVQLYLVLNAVVCCKYQDFVDRGKLLTTTLLSQGYHTAKLVSTVNKFYGRHHYLVDPKNVSVSKLLSDGLSTVWLSNSGLLFH